MVLFIGMKTQVVDVKSFVKVVLVTESKMMDEVMVVAHGTAKRSAFTGSASVVNAEKLSKRQTTNVVQALELFFSLLSVFGWQSVDCFSFH